MLSFLWIILVCLMNFVLGQKAKINISVYYETLCPDSIDFVVHQLYPSLQGNLKELVKLELIPYGKATRTSDNNQNVTFTCQHGPNECYGNLIMGCARDLIDYGNNSEGLGFNTNHLEFVNCFMKDLTTQITRKELEFAVIRCSKPKVISAVRLMNCANNTFGIQHLIQYGKITDRFQFPLKRVPTIVYNGKYTDEESRRFENNFLGELCSKIEKPQPDECINQSVRSGMSSKAGSILISQLVTSSTLLIFIYYKFSLLV